MNLKRCAFLCLLSLFFTLGCERGVATKTPTEPELVSTKRVAVKDTYHGVEVVEEYRWLEDWNDKEVKEWTKQQDKYADDLFASFPSAKTLRPEIEAVLKGISESYNDIDYAGGSLFALKYAPPKQQEILVVTNNPNSKADIRTIFDPNEFDPTGATTIDFYSPSHDGKMVAISLSKSGTESGDLYVIDVATGKRLYEIVPGVNGGTAGGDLAWAKDNGGFFYSRYPRGNERPEKDKSFYVQVYYHGLGTPTEKDRYEIGKEFPRIAEIELRMNKKSGRLLATVQKGDGGEFAHYMRSPAGSWKQFSVFGDKIVEAVFGPKDTIYLISCKGAPRGKLLRISAVNLDVKKADVIIAEGTDTLVSSFWGAPSIVVTDSRIYAEFQTGGPSELRAFDFKGKSALAPKQLPVSSVGDLRSAGGDNIFFSDSSFINPGAIYYFDAAKTKTIATAMQNISPATFEGVEVVREFATSKDGTKVPVNILKPKGIKLDGTHPLILYGYGGYGVNISPRFKAVSEVLLKHGVIYAIANIRGGGEYGEDWHLQGNLTNKQNVFDDFYAAANHLIEKGYTSHARLGLRGGSNGGLLMGAMITQHPELARAVVSHVGIYDMLRVELSSNGEFNITEFGTVKDPDQFAALYAYSPYHRVRDGIEYPAIMFTAAVNDPRVEAMQSRKMTARLQAANKGKNPIILRTHHGQGHGGGKPLDARVDEYVEEFSFYFQNLNVQ